MDVSMTCPCCGQMKQCRMLSHKKVEPRWEHETEGNLLQYEPIGHPGMMIEVYYGRPEFPAKSNRQR